MTRPRAVAVLTAASLAGCIDLDHVAVSTDSVALEVGDARQLVAEARGACPCVLYSSEGKPGAFRWATSTPGVAAVGDRGLVTARAPGEARVTATTDGVTGEGAVRVVAPAAAVQFAAAAAPTLHPGDTLRRPATAVGSAGGAVLAIRVRYASSDTAIAAVDASGTIVARRPGAATIRAATLRAGATLDVRVAAR